MTEYHQMWEPPAGPAELQRGAEDHEDATEKHSVAPGAVRPAQDLFGDLLMEMHSRKKRSGPTGRR